MNRFGTFLRQWLPMLRHTWYLRILLVLGLLWMVTAVLGWGDILLVREIPQGNALPTSPDGRLYAQASGTREMRRQRNIYMSGYTSLTIHQLNNNAPIHRLDTWNVRTLAYGHHGRLVATASRDLTVQVWRLADSVLLHTLTLDTTLQGSNWATTLDFSPDDSLLAAGTVRGDLAVWRVADGTPVLTQPGLGDDVEVVVFSPDGRYLAVAHRGGGDRIELWRTSDWQIAGEVRFDGVESPTSLAFSPDGTRLAASFQVSTDGQVRLWQVRDGALVEERSWNTADWSFAVAFSPDGRYLATGGDAVGQSGFLGTWELWPPASTITLWPVTGWGAGLPAQRIRVPQGYSQELVFSADGQQLVSSGDTASGGDPKIVVARVNVWRWLWG